MIPCRVENYPAHNRQEDKGARQRNPKETAMRIKTRLKAGPKKPICAVCSIDFPVRPRPS